MEVLFPLLTAFISGLVFLSIFLREGLVYFLHYTVSYIYLTFESISRKHRFDVYDFCAVGKPKKNGFFVAEEECRMDPPSTTADLRKNADEVFIFGTNSKEEYLAVHVCRLPGHKIQCSLHLRLSNGQLYILPEKHTIQKATSENDTFGSARLKLQCLVPMRKWRIFFNGMLEEKQDDPSVEPHFKFKHVRFSFIWTASSEVFDFSTDFSKTLFSHAVASSLWLEPTTYLIKKLKNIFNGYEQPGMILGTITVDNEPQKEVYLWGTRRRYMGRDMFRKQSNATEIYGNFTNGSLLHLGVVKNYGTLKKLLYGYMMKPNGFIFPIEELCSDHAETIDDQMTVKYCADNKWYELNVRGLGNDVTFQKKPRKITSIRKVDLKLNGRDGRGFIFKKNADDDVIIQDTIHRCEQTSGNPRISSPAYCISFNSEFCPKAELCGGKGSSLGTLYTESLKIIDNGSSLMFYVPNGFVVSTNAYAEFIKGPLEKSLQKFEKDVWSKNGDRQALCQRMEERIKNAELPEKIRLSIAEEMNAVFGSSFSDYSLAVRSSATGEDTQQMSAAGQMETFLGIRDLDQVLEAVKKCWSSQFSFRAVEYKRGYGQALNTPMAVVVQEMVPCEAAGVIFTCNPVTGDPSSIHITANWGLGESVVSASADPDTITLDRSLDNEICLNTKQIGKKSTKIIMAANSGVMETQTDNDETTICCISDEVALKLSRIAVEIEKQAGSPRDIEWGIKGGNIYLFQSRPVTTLDVETEFETKHMFDTYQRLENCFWTKANVGEVMPGASSPLTIDMLQKIQDIVQPRLLVQMNKGLCPHKPYYQKGLVYAFNHTFMNLVGGFLAYDDAHQEETNAFIISLFGRLIDFTEIRRVSADVVPQTMTSFKKVFVGFYFLTMSFISGIVLRRNTKKIKSVQIECKGMNSEEMLHKIGQEYDVAAEGMKCHMNCTMSSSFWNMSLLSFLAKVRGDWDNSVFSDFAHLLSTCNDVESADVPAAIQELGVAISKEIDPDAFKKMSFEEALYWITNLSSHAGNKFKQFLLRHGHRGLKEFDVYAKTWSTDPRPLITMLQAFVNEKEVKSIKKENNSFSSVVSKLHVDLNFKNRLRLRWLLPNARRAVRERELSKSLVISTMNTLRKPFYELAERMVEEGRLPAKEPLFFLCVDEINQLIKTRSPRLVAKATRRWKVHKELDKLIFPEICPGIPKQINNDEHMDASGAGFIMTGVPVGQGIVKATAKVVMDLDEAATIQQGDILITYSTDIGWSPYFPLLSGVVTELGGLISHGAVVAREYGLPCVVSLHGATRAFKSGDIVILDGSKGTLQKVEN